MANPFLNQPTYTNSRGQRTDANGRPLPDNSSGGANAPDPRNRNQGGNQNQGNQGNQGNQHHQNQVREAQRRTAQQDRRLEHRENRQDRRQDRRDAHAQENDGPGKLTAKRFGNYTAQDDQGYYDPQFANNPNRGAQNTGFGKFYFEQNPEAGFDWFLNNRVGVNPRGEDAIPDYFDSYLQDQYGQAQADYQTALQDAPNLKWRRFLTENLQGGALNAETLRQNAYSVDPRERGELGGPATSRWVPF